MLPPDAALRGLIAVTILPGTVAESRRCRAFRDSAAMRASFMPMVSAAAYQLSVMMLTGTSMVMRSLGANTDLRMSRCAMRPRSCAKSPGVYRR